VGVLVGIMTCEHLDKTGIKDSLEKCSGFVYLGDREKLVMNNSKDRPHGHRM
jgi:hypothetical protein